MMNATRLAISSFAVAIAVFGATGCATKKYVRTQTAPIIEHADRLDDQSAANAREIRSVDERAQAGIGKAQSSADAASQNAQAAAKAAGDAQSAADLAVHRADSLASVIKSLDDYKPSGDVSVLFAFDKAILTKEAKAQLDQFAAQLTSAHGYILEVTGGTDSTGSSSYNYQLSQRRADAVVEYLASHYNIPAHRFYLIGIGKDKQIGSERTAAGRKANRRVTVQLLSNAGLNAK